MDVRQTVENSEFEAPNRIAVAACHHALHSRRPLVLAQRSGHQPIQCGSVVAPLSLSRPQNLISTGIVGCEHPLFAGKEWLVDQKL